MRAEWPTEDLVGSWTLVDDDWRLVGNKSGPTRLGFALLLKFFELEARFPNASVELPPVAVEYVAEQVKVGPGSLADYPWSGRAIERHRAQVQPDATVRPALFPAVGEGTLRDLVKEAKTNKRAFQARVRTVLHSSYTHHYRRMLPPLLAGRPRGPRLQ